MCGQQSEHVTDKKGGETMKKITKIETPKIPETAKKLRVAAYCRVSTGMEDQLVSLEMQKAHYEELINADPAWELSGSLPGSIPMRNPERKSRTGPVFRSSSGMLWTARWTTFFARAFQGSQGTSSIARST